MLKLSKIYNFAKNSGMQIQENLVRIKQQIPENVNLVAVSKTKPNEDILEAYAGGQRAFGENKAQEIISKQPELPADIQWHFIGHLQRNKVKYIVPFVHLIHSVDSARLLREINKEAAKINRITDCLLQFHIATEETKFGLDMQEAAEILTSDDFVRMNHINIRGVMGMATFTEDQERVKNEFNKLVSIFKYMKTSFFKEADSFSIISGGMSGDYPLAIEAGCNMIRVGSDIFGERVY